MPEAHRSSGAVILTAMLHSLKLTLCASVYFTLLPDSQETSLHLSSHMSYTESLWQPDYRAQEQKSVKKKKLHKAAAGHSFIGRSQKTEKDSIGGDDGILESFEYNSAL